MRNDDEDYLSMGYINTKRYLIKSQGKEVNENNFICKYCKRRLANAFDLNDHMVNKHFQKYQKKK
jgi:hypothetical protein